MKSATHMLVTMEIERTPTPIRDQDVYRRARLPAVYAEHYDAWRRAYAANPSITINQLVEMVCGFKVEAQAVSRSKMERNMANVRELARTQPVDPLTNLAGIAKCRRALRGQA
jgi:hypothetical protein